MLFQYTILTLMFMIKAEGSSLNLALGIQWSSYAQRGLNGQYLSKDFGGHVVLPIMEKVADELLRMQDLDTTQNWVLVVLVMVVSSSAIAFLSFVFIKKNLKRPANMQAQRVQQYADV